ncbi:MAG: SdpI family protein [Erysipelotrichaceae bacterium]|nr:SdpI family protein [Erysipelotrichaceae bacterium]
MGFWFFMTCCILLIPLTMIGFGLYFQKKAPQEINILFGYRTEMSMKNKETWEFAHYTIGNIWYRTGLVLMIIVIFIMLCLFQKDINTISIAGTIMMMIQLIPLIASIFLTEAALKKHFDKDGNRK